MTNPAATPSADEIRAAVIAASEAYFAQRRARVKGFVDEWFSLRGSLRLHRHALGWDILRAPANIAMAPVLVLSRLLALLLGMLGAKKAATWLRTRQFMMETAVMREVRRLVIVELLEMPYNEEGAHSDADALAATIIADPEIRRMLATSGAPGGVTLSHGLKEYTGSRSAVAEMTTALATMGAGAAVFQKLTPGALTLGPAIAAAMAHSAAVASFPLGATIGSVWYGIVTPSVSPSMVIGTTAVLMLAASVFAAFSGVIADPVQRRLGVHRRRLHRLIDALERQFARADTAGFSAREHYVARLLDLMDAGAAAARSLRF